MVSESLPADAGESHRRKDAALLTRAASTSAVMDECRLSPPDAMR